MQRSILLIDDEPDVIRSLGRYFERAGWEVHRAMTGEEGVRLYEAEHPDLVLLDIHMPGICGIDALEMMVPRDATVVMLTGNAEISAAVEAMQLGAENFITKPADAVHLEAVAVRASEKAVLRRANRMLAGSGRAPRHAWAGRR